MNRAALALILLALPTLPCLAQEGRLAELAVLPENRKLEPGDWVLLAVEENEGRPGRPTRKVKEEQLWVVEQVGEHGTLLRVELSDRNTWIVLPYRADEVLRGLHLLFLIDDRFTDALKNSRPGDLPRPELPTDHIGLKFTESKEGRRFEGSGERPGGGGDRFEIAGDLTAEAGLFGLSKARYEIKTKARKSWSREIKCLSQGRRGVPFPDFDFGNITDSEKRARFSADPLAGLKLGITARYAVKDVTARAGVERDGEQIISIEIIDEGGAQVWKITPIEGKPIIGEGTIKIPESERSARRPLELVRGLKGLRELVERRSPDQKGAHAPRLCRHGQSQAQRRRAHLRI